MPPAIEMNAEDLESTSSRARIRVPGLEADVAVEDVGESTPELRAGIDAAYSAKYGPRGGTERMVTDEAATATLRINPDTSGT